jgi:6-phosphogluconate dehydrogenase
MINAAIEEAVPAAVVLSAALCARFGSRQAHGLANKLRSVMRKDFDGHREPRRPEVPCTRRCRRAPHD